MLSVFELLQLTFAIFRKNAGLYIGYSAWLLIPAAVMFAAETLMPTAGLAIEIVGQMAMVVFGLWIWIMLTLITANIIAREKINTDHLSKKAWQLIWPVALVGLVTGLVELVGFVLFIIPGIVFMVWYALAQTDVVMSDRRGMAAMSASREMTRGRSWRVLWRLIGGPLIVGLFYVALSSSIISLVEFMSTGAVTLFSETPSLVANTLGLVTDSLILPVFVIYMTLLYLDLKQTLKGAKK